MLSKLFTSCCRLWRSRKPKTIQRPFQNRRSGATRRPQLELLEDRLAPSATEVFGGLEFSTAGTFTTTNNVVSSTSPVQVGVNPATGSTFTPLLQLNNGVQFTATDTTGTFTTNGSVSGFAGGVALPLLDAHLHTFQAPGLLGTSYFSLASGDTNSSQLSVADGSLAVTALHLSSQELDLQGSLSLPGFSGLSLAVQGTNHVALNSSGVFLTGLNVTLAGPTTFTVADLPITTQNLQVEYSSTTNTFDASGSASVTVAGNTLGLTLGSSSAPGLVIANGNLQSLQATVNLASGDSDTPFKVGSVSFGLTSATFSYDQSTSSFGIGADATLALHDQTVNLKIGSDGMPGIVIQNGTLTTLEASVTSNITIGGLTIETTDLTVNYTAGQDVMITGTASIDLKDGQTDQTLSVTLGSTDSTGVMHPGIDISLSTGQIVSFDAVVNTDITIAGLEIKATDLGIQYDTADNNLVISGGASFTLDDHTVSILLGGSYSPGLVIQDGQLVSLEAAVSGEVDLLGLSITATNLTVAYVAASGNTPEEFALFGAVSVEASFINFSTTLGSEQDPGIVIAGGQLQSVNITVDGSFTLAGLTFAANGLTIQYSSSTQQLELSGGVMVQLTSSIEVSASITKGGLLIDTSTGALSIDTSNGLEIKGGATFGPFSIQNLDIAFSNGPNGVNFHASGEVDLPGGISVDLIELDIEDGQLADIGLSIMAPIPIGDTGFFLDGFSGDLENLNNLSQLQVMGSATVTFGDPISVPSIPGIFQGGSFALVEASGSITVSASDLILSANVSILGGLLGQGSATIDLNWATGVYMVSGSFGIFDNIITFAGALTITNQGDITLQAVASVNVPSFIPFIGGDSLGSLNFYLQYRPGEDWTQSYVAAWTTVNLFVTSFTFGFKVDFEGDFSLLSGNDVQNIGTAVATTPPQPVTYAYAQDVQVTDPNAAGADVTINSPNFLGYSYADMLNNDSLSGTEAGAAGGFAFTSYQLSQQNPILPSLKFEVYINYPDDTVDVGTATFDANGNFHFAPTGNSGLVPTSATVEGDLVDLAWPGVDPGATSITATYYTSGAYLEVLQKTSNNQEVSVGKYAIDPVQNVGQGGGMVSASAGGQLYTDNLTNSAPVQQGGNWTSAFTLSEGDPDPQTLTVNIYSGQTLLGQGTFDANRNFHFSPNGTPALAPASVFLNDNELAFSWTSNPGPISITAMYRSLTDRVIHIDFNNDVTPGGVRGDYVVELVTTIPLTQGTYPMFSETPDYQAPTASVSSGSLSLNSNGVLTGTVLAQIYTPESDQPNDTSSTISLYYSSTDSTATGGLIGTYNYSDFTDNGPDNPRSYQFTSTALQNLPAGDYYIYAVVGDSQSPPQDSDPTDAITLGSPAPVPTGPSFVALTPSGKTGFQALFSAANGTALGVTDRFNAPVTVDLTISGGSLIPPGGSPTTEFTQTYATPAAATAALNGLTFVSDSTFSNSTTLTFTATTTINGIKAQGMQTSMTYTGVQTIPLLTPNTHLVVTQWQNDTMPTDPNTAIVTVTVTNPGGPDGQDGTNVQLQDYLYPGVTLLSSSVSQGSFNPTTGLWTIGNLPMTGANTATLILTVKVSPGTADTPLTNIAEASSTLYNFPASDATSVEYLVPRSNAIVISPGTLPEAVVGSAYQVPFTADQGGGGTYTFVLGSGTLPTGLSLSSTGVLSGVPSGSAGTYRFSVTATNQYGVSTTLPLQLVLANTPLAIVGTPYSFNVGSTAFSHYSLVSGSLPPGLQFKVVTGSAVVTGTPTTAGSYTFGIQQISNFGNRAANTQTYTLFVDSVIVPSTTSLPVATVGSLYTATFTAKGGTGSYQIGPSTGQTPAGLSWSTVNGTLSGTIATTVDPGNYTFSVYFTDATGASVTRSYTLLVDPALQVSPGTLPAATVGTPYAQSLTASGGSGTGYTFALTGGSLPAGLSLSPNGTISGSIPVGTLAANASFTVTLTDSTGAATVAACTLTVDPGVAVVPATLIPVEATVPYSTTFTATGGSGQGYTFALTGGSLPTGVSLSPAGSLSGTVAANAVGTTYSFTVTATDSTGDTGSITDSLIVDAALSVGPVTLLAGTVNTPYSQQLTATGGSGHGYTFTLTAGNLPAGLKLSTSGLISGTLLAVAAPGSYDFTITVTDSLGATSSCSSSLDVNPISETWTGAVSTAWSNPANWSSQLVPGAGVNVTIPSHPASGRFPVLDVSATVDTLTLQSGATLTLAGHGLTAYGALTNQGTLILQGNEAVQLAQGNDTKEGTWQYVGDGTGKSLTVADFGTTDYFNLMIADTHAHPDTFQTANNLTVQGTLTITAGTLTASGGSVTTAGLSLSGTGVLNAPSLLNDSGNWTVTAGTFNPNGGTVAFTGASTQQLVSGGRAFFNVTHTGTGTLSLATSPLMVNGSLTNTVGVLQSGSLGLTVAGTTTLTGGTFLAGLAPVSFNAGLTLNGGTFQGTSGGVTAAGITLIAGTLTAPTATLTDSGNWTNSGGTFNANNGIVLLKGSNQSISGNTTFHTLEKIPGVADTLTFQAGSAQTITGTLLLEGSTGKPLALRSSVPGSMWNLAPMGVTVVSFVDMQDGHNSKSLPITVTDSHNTGDNSNWVFPAMTESWTGTNGSSTSTASNWSLGYVPNATDSIVIPATAHTQPILDSALSVQNLTIAAGAKLTLAGHALTVNGTFANPGTLILQGNETIALAKGNDTIEGTWDYVGDNSGGTITLQDFGTIDYFNLIVADSHIHSDTFQASAPLAVKGSLTVTAGIFDAHGNTTTVTGQTTVNGGTYLAGTATQTFGGLLLSSGAFTGSSGTVNVVGVTITGGTLTAPAILNDSGNWTFTAGTFNANGGTVALTGLNQHINGSTTFFNLSKSVSAADTLTFQAGATQTLLGTLTLQGSAGKLLSLRSSTTGTAWDVDPLGAALLSFLDVKDCKNLGILPITAVSSHNSGNNTRVNFA